ncbi:hypothetical protein [Hyphomonas sp.]|uniref:hypothetical protein n=1 Tax=Hyphomonas sp. TaxID=87 RepID=UPI00391DDB88
MTRPRPDLWYPLAQLLAALRTLLRAAAPDAFAAIARDARAQLAVLTALVRRYIHILAAETPLPPLRTAAPPTDRKTSAPAPRRDRRALFQLLELPAAPGRPGSGEDPPALQWALLIEAAARLAAVLADPAPHARRLARRFGTLLVPGLRELPVPWHVTRRLAPEVDTLLCAMDQAARPLAWAGINSS